MKFLKFTPFLIVILSALSGEARATDLKGDSWVPFQAPLPAFGASFTGFITDAGDVRVDGYEKTMSVTSFLYAPSYSSSKLSAFQYDCNLIDKNPSLAKYSPKDTFNLKTMVNPFAHSIQRDVVEKLRSQNPAVKATDLFQNNPQVFGYAVDLVIGSDSIISKGHYNAAFFEDKIASQFKEQKSEIAESGAMDINLSGLQPLICDLVSGKVQLHVIKRIMATAAKPAVVTYVTADEVSSLHKQLQSQFKSSSASVSDSYIVAAIQFGVASARSLSNVSSIPLSKLVSLFREFFTFPAAGLKPLQEQDFQTLAHDLDDLKPVERFDDRITINQNIQLVLGSEN